MENWKGENYRNSTNMNYGERWGLRNPDKQTNPTEGREGCFEF